jgi:hypothetical protein
MNRPAPILVFSDQRRTKSTIWSRVSCGTQTPVRVPQLFFLGPHVPPSVRPKPHPSSGSSFQKGDSLLFRLMVGPSSLLESCRSVLEELLLPAVEHRRLEPQFITQIRDRHSFQQMPPQNGDLLFRCVVLPLLLCSTIGLAPASGAGLWAGTQRTRKKTATNSLRASDTANLLRPPVIREAFDGGKSELRSFRVVVVDYTETIPESSSQWEAHTV